MISRKQILHIAKLAKLRLTEAEVEKFQREIDNILEYISQIKNIDVNDVDKSHHLLNYRRNVLQKDKPRKFENFKKLLSNATNGRLKNGFIKTSKIIDKE
ncbi:MAG: aspartyl/glutamyl-tRNA(Asn/Gln) amidotransferase subunit C [Candidatus Dojkabacteria bacterium]|nr:MAG: aspartyl/glutamyl-tRNA(Asn/Gln) amidotransferase subunit C [Candidatus Dojkabacteria bacterium]